MRKPARAAEFLGRDWASLEASNSAHFATLRRTKGPAAIMALGDELRRQAILHRPSWPTDEDRARDRADHLRLLEILDRVPARDR